MRRLAGSDDYESDIRDVKDVTEVRQLANVAMKHGWEEYTARLL